MQTPYLEQGYCPPGIEPGAGIIMESVADPACRAASHGDGRAAGAGGWLFAPAPTEKAARATVPADGKGAFSLGGTTTAAIPWPPGFAIVPLRPKSNTAIVLLSAGARGFRRTTAASHTPRRPMHASDGWQASAPRRRGAQAFLRARGRLI